MNWSPIQGWDDWDTAVARAWSLTTAARPYQQHSDAAHWIERAQALLAPLLHAAALTTGDLADLLTWLHRRDVDQLLTILARHRSGLAFDLLAGIAATDHRELSGIYSTADSVLSAYRTTAALDAARHPNFDPDTFANSTDTVYLCAPGITQAQYAPLIVALLQHVRAAVTRRLGPWPPMIWCLDEVANIAPLPDLPGIVADSAAQGLLICACLQDLSQARWRWGPAADGFLTLFADKIILPGIADLATLQTISAVAATSNNNAPPTPGPSCSATATPPAPPTGNADPSYPTGPLPKADLDRPSSSPAPTPPPSPSPPGTPTQGSGNTSNRPRCNCRIHADDVGATVLDASVKQVNDFRPRRDRFRPSSGSAELRV